MATPTTTPPTFNVVKDDKGWIKQLQVNGTPTSIQNFKAQGGVLPSSGNMFAMTPLKSLSGITPSYNVVNAYDPRISSITGLKDQNAAFLVQNAGKPNESVTIVGAGGNTNNRGIIGNSTPAIGYVLNRTKVGSNNIQNMSLDPAIDTTANKENMQAINRYLSKTNGTKAINYEWVPFSEQLVKPVITTQLPISDKTSSASTVYGGKVVITDPNPYGGKILFTPSKPLDNQTTQIIKSYKDSGIKRGDTLSNIFGIVTNKNTGEQFVTVAGKKVPKAQFDYEMYGPNSPDKLNYSTRKQRANKKSTIYKTTAKKSTIVGRKKLIGTTSGFGATLLRKTKSIGKKALSKPVKLNPIKRKQSTNKPVVKRKPTTVKKPVIRKPVAHRKPTVVRKTTVRKPTIRKIVHRKPTTRAKKR